MTQKFNLIGEQLFELQNAHNTLAARSENLQGAKFEERISIVKSRRVILQPNSNFSSGMDQEQHEAENHQREGTFGENDENTDMKFDSQVN